MTFEIVHPRAIPCPECHRPAGLACVVVGTSKPTNTHKARAIEAKAELRRATLGIEGTIAAASARAIELLGDLGPAGTLRRGCDGVYRRPGGPSLPPPVAAELRRLSLIREACGQGGHVAILTALGRDVVSRLRERVTA